MTQYQVAHVDGAYRVFATDTGIDRTYFEPAFRKPPAAIEYSDVLAGLPGRHRSPDLARDRISTASRDEVAVPIETPVAASRTCVICGRDLPLGSRPQRRTDTDRCRRALARQDAAERLGADMDGGPRSVVTVSDALRPVVATRTSRATLDASAPPSSFARGARVHPSPAGPPTGLPSLGF